MKKELLSISIEDNGELNVSCDMSNIPVIVSTLVSLTIADDKFRALMMNTISNAVGNATNPEEWKAALNANIDQCAATVRKEREPKDILGNKGYKS